MPSAVQQFDFGFNDPRRKSVKKELYDDLKVLRNAWDKHGAVLSCSQAASLIGCAPSYVHVLIGRNQFTVYNILGLKCIPLDEVHLYLKMKANNELPTGGGSAKGKKIKDLLKK